MADFDSFRSDYQFVEASLTAVLKGQLGAGAKGDILDHVVIIPLTTGAGDVSIQDGNAPAVAIFKAGTLADLKPHFIPLGARSIIGAWSIATGANVRVYAKGRFQ